MADTASAPTAPLKPPLSGDADARRTRELARWARHSAQVHRLRRLLPGAIGVIIALMTLWIGYRAFLSAFNAANSAVGEIHMLDPQFHGINDKGRPYVLGAKEAIRDGHDLNKITLVAPSMRLDNEDGGQARVISRAGFYREDTKILTLTGDVNLDDGKGARFRSDRAVIDINAESVVGDSHVSGESPLGRTEASSYAVMDRGAHIVFRGQVRSRISNDRGASR